MLYLNGTQIKGGFMAKEETLDIRHVDRKSRYYDKR